MTAAPARRAPSASLPTAARASAKWPATAARSAAPEHAVSSGVSLIEALVALLLFSVGSLAVAGLQIVSQKTVTEATQHSLAAFLAQDMLDRLRANNATSALRVYVGETTPWPQTWVGRGRRPAPATDCGQHGKGCTPEQLARHDLSTWEGLMDSGAARGDATALTGLSLPTACILGPTDGRSGIYTVTVTWRGGLAMPAGDIPDCGHQAQEEGQRLYGENEEFRRSLALFSYIVAQP